MNSRRAFFRQLLGGAVAVAGARMAMLAPLSAFEAPRTIGLLTFPWFQSTRLSSCYSPAYLAALDYLLKDGKDMEAFIKHFNLPR